MTSPSTSTSHPSDLRSTKPLTKTF